MRKSSGLLVGCLLALTVSIGKADNPTTQPTVERPYLFAMSTALTGPTADLGQHMRLGVETAFNETNRKGGINGRPLQLTVLDDGYEPSRTGPNIRQLLDDNRVIGIVGNVGTPTAVVTVPIAQEKKVPFIGAFSGASCLRQEPPNPYVINFRASYNQEIREIINGLTDTLHIKPEEIAFFTQCDLYGDSGWTAGVLELKKHGLKNEKDILHTSYERNSDAVEACVADLLTWPAEVKAVVMMGTYKPSAKFIRLARKHGMKPLFVNVSFVGAESLANELGDQREGVLVTQVVPPFDTDVPAIKALQQDLKESSEQLNAGVLEGYLVGQMVIQAISQSQTPIQTGIDMMNALENMGDFDPGINHTLHLSADCHQASNRVWLTMIRQNSIKSVTWKDVATTN